jgi:hypothetical protein
VELVRVAGRPGLGGVQGEPGSAQFIGLVPVGDPGELDQEPAGMPAQRVDPERAGRGRVGGQHAAHGEAPVRLVGAYLHRHLAADPVRPGDPADDQLHDGLRRVS